MLLAFVVTAFLASLVNSTEMKEISSKSNSTLSYFDYLLYAYKVQSKCRYKGVECYAYHFDNFVFRTGHEKIPLFGSVYFTKNMDEVSERSESAVYDVFKRYNLEVSTILLKKSI